MTQAEFDEFIKHNGFVEYRGRRFFTPNDVPIGEAQGLYLYNTKDDNKWFVAGRAELLTSAYIYIPKEEQLVIDGPTNIISNTVIKVRRSGHKKQRSSRKV